MFVRNVIRPSFYRTCKFEPHRLVQMRKHFSNEKISVKSDLTSYDGWSIRFYCMLTASLFRLSPGHYSFQVLQPSRVQQHTTTLERSPFRIPQILRSSMIGSTCPSSSASGSSTYALPSFPLKTELSPFQEFPPWLIWSFTFQYYSPRPKWHPPYQLSCSIFRTHYKT